LKKVSKDWTLLLSYGMSICFVHWNWKASSLV
jgi:hypothetical protein